ncbi:MAG: hydroxymethylbilane synthase [Candidatus Lambdaproteobacteria bacterium]|nr:hydroxymethylbilane synthase [Candidatus Lambdaproteobacteria bacterium]
MTNVLRVGTRASALALQQTLLIVERLRECRPDLRYEVVEITTMGDRFREVPITAMGQQVDRGIFNSALEIELLEERVDLATCSFKDVESQLPPGIHAVSVLPREDVRDVLVTRHGTDLAGLPQGAVLATSSPRRVSQLRAFRPDFRFEPLRGNVTTRVERDPDRFDGVILAGAGLLRLGLAGRISQWISEEILLPAPAQAALGCEFLAERGDVAELVDSIQEPDTERCVRAEKALLVRLSGGCFAPIGALARIEGQRMRLRGRVCALAGTPKAEAALEGPAGAWEELVAQVAERLVADGATEIIRETRERLEQQGR